MHIPITSRLQALLDALQLLAQRGVPVADVRDQLHPDRLLYLQVDYERPVVLAVGVDQREQRLGVDLVQPLDVPDQELEAGLVLRPDHVLQVHEDPLPQGLITRLQVHAQALIHSPQPAQQVRLQVNPPLLSRLHQQPLVDLLRVVHLLRHPQQELVLDYLRIHLLAHLPHQQPTYVEYRILLFPQHRCIPAHIQQQVAPLVLQSAVSQHVAAERHRDVLLLHIRRQVLQLCLLYQNVDLRELQQLLWRPLHVDQILHQGRVQSPIQCDLPIRLYQHLLYPFLEYKQQQRQCLLVVHLDQHQQVLVVEKVREQICQHCVELMLCELVPIILLPVEAVRQEFEQVV